MPTPTDAFDARAYSREVEKGWSSAAPHFRRVSARYFGPATEPFFEFAGLAPGQRVLDVACGPGTSTRRAARRVGPRGSVLGVDISPRMISLARGPARGAARFARMDAEDLALPDRSFDAVLCHLGLMLFARPERALAEMVRVLKPGGALSCLVLGSPRAMPFTSLLAEILPRRAPGLIRPGAPGLGGFAAPGALERALAGAGVSEIAARRLRGRFLVRSPRSYWVMALKAFGLLGPLLASLPAETRRAVRLELFERLREYQGKDGLEIPYEFVMARGRAPGRG